MKNRYRIIVCDLEEKEVMFDKEIDNLIGSYAVGANEKGGAYVYSIGFGAVSMNRINAMERITKKMVKKFKREAVKIKLKEMFGVRENEC